jgi:hypothetical protein
MTAKTDAFPLQDMLQNSDQLPPTLLSSLRGVCGLTEIFLTLSKLVVVLVCFGVVLQSVLAGVAPLWALLRGITSVLGVGLLLWPANWMFSKGAAETVLAQIQDDETAEPISTIEKQA